MSSVSYVENLLVVEPFEPVTVFFRDNFPCDKQRSWFSGFQRIISFAAAVDFDTDSDICINCLNLTQESIRELNLLLPNNDVIFSQIDSNYSSVKPICVQNKTAYYIKLQQGMYQNSIYIQRFQDNNYY